ncbi:carbonic anhydrase [Viridibacillus sp. NPDC093762]|uniref:carbonic anhydrase n=1 Tax=Viridibacillus sp. NPDC093762 TaxID=3390720 RepID=UPI003CFCC488
MEIKKFIGIFVASACISVAVYGSLTYAPEKKLEEEKVATTAKPIEWSYEGDTAPNKWASLDPSFAMCGKGTAQSPINIDLEDVLLDKNLGDIKINYQPTLFKLMNNGHTIQATDDSGKNSIEIDGDKYTFLRMHFHTPSEHQINGQHYAMEAHLVHENSKGEKAVLGILINAGNENKLLRDIWSKLPTNITEADIPLTNTINLAKLLPTDKKVYRYSGSLTTPPCSEGVKWSIMEQPIEMSKEQINAFKAIFSNNNRPVQPLNNRKVLKMQE